jgi:hypothetical protein
MNLSNTERVDLPPKMRGMLEEYRRRVWIVKVAEGVLAGLFGLVMSYLLVLVLDRFWDTSAWFRGAMLIGGSVGMLIFFPLKCHRWIWCNRHLEQVARLLKHKFPRFGDRLLGIVELARNDAEQQRSRALVEAAMKQVDDELEDRNFNDAVPNAQHRRWAWAAGVPVVLALVVFMWIPLAGSNAFVRWLMPWLDTPRYTFAQLESLPDEIVVPYAEPFEFNVALRDGSPWSPQTGSAQYQDQTAIDASLANGGYLFTLPPQKDAGGLSLHIGDARKSITIKPITRPELISLAARVELPEYLQYSKPLSLDVRGGSTSVVAGSTVRFEAEATRALADASVDGQDQTIDGASFVTHPISVSSSTSHQFKWTDHLGLSAREPLVLKLNALEDEAPVVFCRKLQREQVVLETDVVSFKLRGEDDFGIRRMGLEWAGIKDPLRVTEPAKGAKLVSGGKPELRELEAVATFSAKRENVKPQTIRIRAYVEDYLPERGRIYSPVYVVHVLSRDEHSAWVTDQLGRWFSSAREVYEQELRLNEGNRRLYDMKPEDLNKPEARRKIQQQAAAESANAARLGHLTDAGTDLLKQAARNDQFDPKQLETWAKMLQQLKGIAGDKMPSVAALLKQAAEAPGAGQPGEGKPGDQLASAQNPGEGKPSQGKPGEGKPGEGKQGQGQPGQGDGQPMPGGQGKPGESSGGDPSESKPGGGTPAEPSKGKTPPKAGSDKSSPAEGGGDMPPSKGGVTNPTPTIQDVESDFNPTDPAGPPPPPAPPTKGGLTLPGTVIKGSGREPGDEEPQLPPDAPVDQVLGEALVEQQELLDEFARIADELQKILGRLENSTFVKRFKAASRRQTEISSDLNGRLLGAFGVAEASVQKPTRKRGMQLAEREEAQSDNIYVIQEDLDAYYGRKQEAKFKRVLDEMKQLQVTSQIKRISETIRQNHVGQSISESEFWADTLDRWAEQLVDPLDPPEGPPMPGEGGELPSLPPELILEVMRILDGEVELRDETRELEQGREVQAAATFDTRAKLLSQTQGKLEERTAEVIKKIRELPNGASDFEKEIQLLSFAGSVMTEAKGILATPETGPTAIAAETEVIEILLQAQRQAKKPGGGGGGGGMPGEGGAGTTSQSALSLIGRGADASAHIEKKQTKQATGSSGGKWPEEFRDGLDDYFDALERRQPKR